LKVSTVRQDLVSDGSEFQVRGAATEKYLVFGYHGPVHVILRRALY